MTLLLPVLYIISVINICCYDDKHIGTPYHGMICMLTVAMAMQVLS